MHIPTQAGNNGKMYPYNPSNPGFLRKFSIGFRGCFKCINQEYWNRNKCPVGDSNDPSMVQRFYRELAIHKPCYQQQQDDYLQNGGCKPTRNVIAEDTAWVILYIFVEHCSQLRLYILNIVGTVAYMLSRLYIEVKTCGLSEMFGYICYNSY